MSPYPLRAVSLCGILALTVLSGNASAQMFPLSFNCGCSTPPIMPVTQYQQVRQTVKRPVYETKWEDREVTAYRPVTQTKTIDMPTTVYDNITEYQTVQRNRGYWTTQMQYRYKPTPCQYDPRSNVFGWLNRTAYSLRAPFIPTAIPRRQYVSNVVSQVVPVVRQVARTEVRKVTFNETKMVAYKTTQKIAVRSLRYVDQEVISYRPVINPGGSRLTYAYPSYGTISSIPIQTVRVPAAAPASASSSSPARSANSESENSNRFSEERGAYTPQQSHQYQFVPVKASPEKPSSTSIVKNDSSRKTTAGRLGGWVVRERKFSKPTRPEPEISVANSKFGGWVVRNKKTSNPTVTAPGVSVVINK